MKNPIEDKKSPYRVARGGSWYNGPYRVSTSYRNDYYPTFRSRYIGFRLVKNVPKDKK